MWAVSLRRIQALVQLYLLQTGCGHVVVGAGVVVVVVGGGGNGGGCRHDCCGFGGGDGCGCVAESRPWW